MGEPATVLRQRARSFFLLLAGGARGRQLPADQAALLVLLSVGPMTVSDIRDTLSLAQASSSELVDRAERAGLVERRKTTVAVGPERRTHNLVRTDGLDARAVLVQLTAKGRRRVVRP